MYDSMISVLAMFKYVRYVQHKVENSWPTSDHFYVLSMLFVFWWNITGLPNTQLIILLIIHNVEHYSAENKQFL